QGLRALPTGGDARAACCEHGGVHVQLIPTPGSGSQAPAIVFTMVFRGGVAALRRTPAQIIEEAPKRTIYRYLPPDDDLPHRALPLLLVPPLAAPAACFDLRRGCSLAGHMLNAGHRTYLLEYGHIAFS